MSQLKKQAQLLNLSDLLPNPLNREIDREKVKKIKQAIVTTGMIKPLVYTEVKTDSGDKMMLTDGHHRYVALKELGYAKVPAVMADERGVETAAQEKPQEVEKTVEAPVAGLGLVREDLGIRRKPHST